MSVDHPAEEGGYDRTPPHDIMAEQCVLGGMLLSKEAITQVVEIVRSVDFYRPAHQTIYDTIVDLFSRGEPVDAISVNAELTKRGEITRVGGAPYLHTLTDTVPTAANAGYYARIVADRAVLRRLVEAGTRIAQIGYSGDGEVDDLVDRAQAEIYRVAEKRTGEDYLPLSDIMPGALDELEAISSHDDTLTGVPTGFTDFDALSNGLHPGQMIIIAARPAVGKSTLALDFARAAAIKHQLTTVFFSLEMGRNEIVMRLLSAEARVPLHTMRSGMMTDDDWARLARRMGEVAGAPLFIDDSPNLSMMEIRAKCRRLKQQHDLKLVIVDYLQLMSSTGRVESRQQEVSEMSRSLKLLAKELEVPVVALSQLNRGPEQRTDKKPQVSDLRESGCLTADTRVLRADTGAEVTMGELFARGERNIPVWSLDERLRLVPRTMTHVFSSGRKQTYRLRLASGREVTASANHPFLTHDGWRPLADLSTGTRLAVPRHVPGPQRTDERPDDEVVLLARLARQEAAVPDGVFGLPTGRLALFLRRLWAEGGSVCWDETTGQARIDYVSADRRLLDGMARLLLRWGVVARIAPVADRGYRLSVAEEDDQRRFLEGIGGDGAQRTQVRHCLDRLRGRGAAPVPDPRSSGVWELVREALREPVTELSPGARPRGGGATAGTLTRGRRRLGRVAAVLEGADLEMLAVNDVFWDEIAEIEPLGEQEVYDATVVGTHNFVANGISVHNSIEQDADMVILLYREDVHEKESPRAGEADLIVAKHRNGPTATVTVAFQGHYSRFVDMAPG
ncbi:replicative DNA helicase [Thermobifida halotolerans]|uniref:Replicative DNA helicase n=1 Tax=Thermobifida halotolerans TaxID=483545 RepID=A0A399FWF4_9ACTN|nr:replicative DNA helicase [Thermobifida halotolerans]UOE19039.1 replicative DNA helicase [Thermobifida halotolerans]